METERERSGENLQGSRLPDLIDGLDAQHLLADKGYDRDAIVAQAEAGNITRDTVTPKSQAASPILTGSLQARHLVENAFFTPQTLGRLSYGDTI